MHVRYKFPKQHKVAKFLELFCQICTADSLNWLSTFYPRKNKNMAFRFGERNSFGKERLIVAVMYRHDRRKQRIEPTLRLFGFMSKSSKSVPLSICGLDPAK